AAPSAPRVLDRGERPAGLARWRADGLVVAAALPPLALFVAREWQVAGAPGFPLDDSWIHLHFARNLAAGAGFAYNPGIPVAGSTAPLWTVLLGVGALVASRPLTLRRVGAFAVVTLVVVAPAVSFSLWTAGTPYPAPAAAKVEGGLVGWLGGVREPAALTWVRRPLAFLREWIVWLATIH